MFRDASASLSPLCLAVGLRSNSLGDFAVFFGDEILPIYIWDYKKAVLRVPINQPSIMECNKSFGNHPSETWPFAGHNFEFRFKAIYVLCIYMCTWYSKANHFFCQPNDYVKNACFTISIHLKTWVVQSSR